MHRRTRLRALLAALSLLILAATSASAGSPGALPLASRISYLSGAAKLSYWARYPDLAPAPLGDRLRALRDEAGSTPAKSVSGLAAFNRDGNGLPQNEESISVCHANPSVLLGGANDLRGYFDHPPDTSAFNLTGWYLSTNAGTSVARDGLLPAVPSPITFDPTFYSAGDPVDVAGEGCKLYAGSLVSGEIANGVAVYRSDAATLASCPGGQSPACWPSHKVIAAANGENQLVDKPWMDVGRSGSAGEVVWVVYAQFRFTDTDSFSSIRAVRCNASLGSCTGPINVSGDTSYSSDDAIVQFPDVRIGPDGSVYVVWARFQNVQESTAPPLAFKLRVAAAGSTSFGPVRAVATETKPLYGLHADGFRTTTMPKLALATVAGSTRAFLAWEGCSATVLDGLTCVEPRIYLTHSDNEGASWSSRKVISIAGDNYFPTLASDEATGKLVVAWYTSRFDPTFHNTYNVDYTSFDAAAGVPGGIAPNQLLVPNEPEADPILGGLFIGDYFQATAYAGKAYIHYNANYRSVPFLGTGPSLPQQDNFLLKVPE